MSEYIVPEKTVVRNDIYPTIENLYDRLVFSGENVVWGNAYGREVIFKGNTLIMGNLYGDNIRVENGNVFVMGNVSGKKITLLNGFIKGIIISTENTVIEDSIVKGLIFSPKISLRNTIVLNSVIAHSRKAKAVLEIIASTARSIASTGDLLIGETDLFIPIIYVKGEIVPRGDIVIADPDSFAELNDKVMNFFNTIIRTKNSLTTPPSINSLQSTIKPIHKISAQNIVVKGVKRFIVLLGEEIVYERSSIVREYVDRLKDMIK